MEMVWNSECFHVYSPGKVNNQWPQGIQKQQKVSNCGTEQASHAQTRGSKSWDKGGSSPVPGFRDRGTDLC